MITKIISGGETGADQGALDAAIKLDIPHGGWLPKGRKTENGRLPEKYQLREMSTGSYTKQTEQNVIGADGTLILSHGELTGGSLLTRRMAKRHGRPWLHVDLDKNPAFIAVKTINDWLTAYDIKVLNVAGTRASKDPKLYQATKDIIESVYYLSFVKDPIDTIRKEMNLPRTVAEAVDRLISELPLKDKAILANMTEEELDQPHFMIGNYIRNNFGLWTGNEELLESCRSVSGYDDLHIHGASFIIILELWKKLCKTHKLRIVK